MSADEFRRQPRRDPGQPIDVVDVMTDALVGRIGNVSETGMLLAAQTRLNDDALYQFRFSLPDREGALNDYELGAHVLWLDDSNPSGVIWIGLRFIAIPEAQLRNLRAWISAQASVSEG